MVNFSHTVTMQQNYIESLKFQDLDPLIRSYHNINMLIGKLMERMNYLIKLENNQNLISTFDSFNLITYGFYAHTHSEDQLLEFIDDLNDFESVNRLFNHLKIIYNSVIKEIKNKFLKSGFKDLLLGGFVEFLYLPNSLDHELLWLFFNENNDIIFIPFDFEYAIYLSSGEFLLSFYYDYETGYFELTDRNFN